MKWEKMIFLGFYLEEKIWRKTGGAWVFFPCAHQNTIYPNQRENERKKSHMFWIEILTSKTFLFFLLLSISSFSFCLFSITSHSFFYPFFCVFIPFCFLICFFGYIHFFCSPILRYYVCVRFPPIHNWIEQISIIYIFYPSSHFSFQLNKWVLYSFNFLTSNQMQP